MSNNNNLEMAGMIFFIFISFAWENMKKEYELWKGFENEISQEVDSSSATTQICNALNQFMDKAAYTLKKGSIIYRARRISTESELPDCMHKVLELIHDSSASYRNLDGFINGAALAEMNPNKDFWGFNAERSGAPEIEKAYAGRINPKGVSYLYAAEQPHTAIVEVRPIIGQMVSVAEIEIERDLILYDFSIPILDFESKEETHDIFRIIAKHISEPNYAGEEGYLTTQYIGNFIKEKQVEGIRFPSSLHKNGINIVLFDTSKDENDKPINYLIKSSCVHDVTEINIITNKMLPPEASEMT